jgi:hypothetical protein
MQTNPHRETVTHVASLRKLQECFRGELSALETYELALKNVTHAGFQHALQEMLASHGYQEVLLSERIRQTGGELPTSSGVWGAFAKAVQAGADLLGDRTVIAALEEGEDRGMALYTEGLDGCDPSTRSFIATELLPRQQHTHELCRALKDYVGD